MPGPAARPAKLKLIEGRGSGRDSGGRKVPTPPAFKRLPPTPPDWLDGVALAEWNRVLPELTRLELTKELDAGLLAAYCRTWSLFVDACRDVDERGITIVNTGSNGFEQHAANPAVAVQLKAIAQLNALAAKFGFTPSDEMKLAKPAEVPSGDEANPFAQGGGA